MGRPRGLRIPKLCVHCEAPFEVTPFRVNKACCSKSCAGYLRGQPDRDCDNCGMRFNPVGTQRFCSWECRVKGSQSDFTLEFVEQNSIPEPNTGCWLWLLVLSKEGYAAFGARPRINVNRRVLELRLGRPLSDDEVSRHTCDNPPCVNPDHLIPGSTADNNEDCVKRGRRPFGSAAFAAKLDEGDIARILKMLSDGVYQKDIAPIFGVTSGAISHIKNGRAWVRAVRANTT